MRAEVVTEPAWWGVAEAASHCHVTPGTWRHYVSVGFAPAPDDPDVGAPRERRRPRWRPETIKAWHATRPGKGGRPRKGHPVTAQPEPRRYGQWVPDGTGVLRAGPSLFEQRQAALLAELRRIREEEQAAIRAADFTRDEGVAARRAYDRVRRGGPPLTPRQAAALSWYKRVARGTEGRDMRPAVERILTMVGVGMSLAAIAEARGCSTDSVVRRLHEAGQHAVVEALRGVPCKPRG